MLGDKLPKTIIRTDISSFYESISHESLLGIINQNNLLSPKSRKIIKQILWSYKRLSGTNEGVPRGIGISAYLAELVMRKVDRAIKKLPGLIYYARYVDDIVVIFIPNPNEPPRNLKQEIISDIENSSSLKVNLSKTSEIIVCDTAQYNFEFLGYKFFIQSGKIRVTLSKGKMDKLKKRVELAFQDYGNLSVINEKLARKLLVKRIRFLTGNTKLANNKSKIVIGIFHSNKYLTDNVQLKKLDSVLKTRIQTDISSLSLKIRLSKYSFVNGFNQKRFSSFTGKDLKSIMKIWR